MAADIPQRSRAQKRVTYGMEQHIGVRMAKQPAVMVNLYAAQNQRAPLCKYVQIVADSDSHHPCPARPKLLLPHFV